MRNLFKLFTVILLFSCNKNEEPQEQIENDSTGEGILVEIDQEIQDTLVSAFLDLIMHYQVYYCVINKEAG